MTSCARPYPPVRRHDALDDRKERRTPAAPDGRPRPAGPRPAGQRPSGQRPAGQRPPGQPPKKKKKRKLKRKYRVLRGIYAAVVILAAIIVVAFIALKISARAPEVPVDPDPSATTQTETEPAPGQTAGKHQRREQTYTFLLACPDQASGNADAIMVVTYDVPNQKLGMLSIPRDTLVNKKNPKINSSMHGGIENLQEVVSDLLGIPLDFYVKIDLNGFVELVDAVDGVDFDVPVEMYYNDPTQDLNIFYQPGMQHLTGQQAMEVCRFRHNADGTGYPLGDIQRSETTRNMMITVAKKVLALNNIVKITNYFDILQRNVETDLTASNITWFISQFLNLDLNTGVTGSGLPGDGNVTYKGTRYCYELYPQESLDIINATVNPYTTPLTLDDLNIFQAP